MVSRTILAQFLNFFLLSCLNCNQIWLNPLVNDRQPHLPHKFEPKKKALVVGAGLREGSEGGRQAGREGERERPSTRWCSDTFLKSAKAAAFWHCAYCHQKKKTLQKTKETTLQQRASERERERERKTEFRDSRSTQNTDLAPSIF